MVAIQNYTECFRHQAWSYLILMTILKVNTSTISSFTMRKLNGITQSRQVAGPGSKPKPHDVLPSFQWHWLKNNGSHSLLRTTCRVGVKAASNQWLQMQVGEGSRHRKAAFVETNHTGCRGLHQRDEQSQQWVRQKSQLTAGVPSVPRPYIIAEGVHTSV